MTATAQPSESPETILQSQRVLIDEAYALLGEENKQLKSSGELPNAELLERKRQLLEKLTPQNEQLKALAHEFRPRDSQIREAISALQNKLMKLFYLDRENEQLLLKASVGQRIPGSNRRGSPSQAQHAYQQHRQTQ